MRLQPATVVSGLEQLLDAPEISILDGE